MAAGLGFKDFVTGEVLTAADVDGYLMQGVWVFANAAARTSAVTSPQEGNMSFLKDTNSTEYYDGSAWVAIGGGSGSGMTLIQRSSFSNVAGTSTTFDGVFTSSYASYLIEIENLGSATAADDLQFVFRISGLDGTAHYGNTMQNAYNAATWTNTTSTNTSQITMYVDNASTTYPIIGQIFVSNIGTNLYSALNGYVFGISGAAYNLFYGYNNSASTYTGFRLKSASSNITGTVAVYGLAKS